MLNYPMYVCDRCGWGHYHPLSYCQRCPGRLHRRIVPHPILKTEAERISDLAKQGIQYTGEYPQLTEQRKLELSIARANEQRAKRLEELQQTTDTATIKQLERGVAYWEDVASRYQQKLDQLGSSSNG